MGSGSKGSALDPLKPFLKKGFENPKNFLTTFIKPSPAEKGDRVSGG